MKKKKTADRNVQLRSDENDSNESRMFAGISFGADLVISWIVVTNIFTKKT